MNTYVNITTYGKCICRLYTQMHMVQMVFVKLCQNKRDWRLGATDLLKGTS